MYVCVDKGQLNKVHSTAIYDFLLVVVAEVDT